MAKTRGISANDLEPREAAGSRSGAVSLFTIRRIIAAAPLTKVSKAAVLEAGRGGVRPHFGAFEVDAGVEGKPQRLRFPFGSHESEFRSHDHGDARPWLNQRFHGDAE